MPRPTPVSIMRLRIFCWWLILLKGAPAFNFTFRNSCVEISFSPSRNADETMAELLSVGADPPLPRLQGILLDGFGLERERQRRGE